MSNIIKQNEIPKLVNTLVNQVMEGEINPLEVFVSIKVLEEAIKQAKKRIQDVAIYEAMRYGENTVNAYDAEITLKNTATRYDYSSIPSIVEKEAELKALKDKHKAAIKHAVVDTDTGELIQPPIVKHGRETISIKLKNK